MQINEVTLQVGLSKRAIKYYEEAGLLKVDKGENGYRNYTQEEIKLLKEIAIYRKLGISIKDIKVLLEGGNKELLKAIYKEKSRQLEASKQELKALQEFIADHDVEKFYGEIDYETVGKAMQEMLPGFYGYFFVNHFIPYLQIKIQTPEQYKAYENIIAFWDKVDIKIPFFMKLRSCLLYRFAKPNIEQSVAEMEKQLKKLIDTPEEEYERLKEQIKEQVERRIKLQKSLFYKYLDYFNSKKKFTKCIQDCGYYAIFIPNMLILSPSYRAYHEALMGINNKVCKDLGLYYDSKDDLVIKEH